MFFQILFEKKDDSFSKNLLALMALMAFPETERKVTKNPVARRSPRLVRFLGREVTRCSNNIDATKLESSQMPTPTTGKNEKRLSSPLDFSLFFLKKHSLFYFSTVLSFFALVDFFYFSSFSVLFSGCFHLFEFLKPKNLLKKHFEKFFVDKKLSFEPFFLRWETL